MYGESLAVQHKETYVPVGVNECDSALALLTNRCGRSDLKTQHNFTQHTSKYVE